MAPGWATWWLFRSLSNKNILRINWSCIKKYDWNRTLLWNDACTSGLCRACAKAIKEKFPNAKNTLKWVLTEQVKEYDAFFSWSDGIRYLLKIQQKFLKNSNQLFRYGSLLWRRPIQRNGSTRYNTKILRLRFKINLNGMHSIDPDANFGFQMGWTFYYMKLWKDDPARLQTMIKAVPENRHDHSGLFLLNKKKYGRILKPGTERLIFGAIWVIWWQYRNGGPN